MFPLFYCLVKGTSFSESGKKVSIKGSELKRNEQVLFFRIDNCYIKDTNRKKCDLLVIYSDSNCKFIILSETKGKNIKEAIKQFEDTVNDERFRNIIDAHKCKSCKEEKCVKLFLIVHGGGISPSSDIKNKIRKKYGFFLELESLTCDLKIIIDKYKGIYEKYKNN